MSTVDGLRLRVRCTLYVHRSKSERKCKMPYVVATSSNFQAFATYLLRCLCVSYILQYRISFCAFVYLLFLTAAGPTDQNEK